MSSCSCALWDSALSRSFLKHSSSYFWILLLSESATKKVFCSLFCHTISQHAPAHTHIGLAPFVTYYCPLVARCKPPSINFTWLFPSFVLLPVCACSLPYHAQTFRGLIRCIVWHRAPIMHHCVHSGFAFQWRALTASTKTGTLMFCGHCKALARVNKALFSQSAAPKLQGECYQSCGSGLCT